jgi:hypothetical protein
MHAQMAKHAKIQNVSSSAKETRPTNVTMDAIILKMITTIVANAVKNAMANRLALTAYALSHANQDKLRVLMDAKTPSMTMIIVVHAAINVQTTRLVKAVNAK